MASRTNVGMTLGGGHATSTFVAHPTSVTCACVGRRSAQVLATGGDDKLVNVWRLRAVSSDSPPVNVWSLSGNASPVEALSFDPRELHLISGNRGGSLRVFDLTEGKITRSLTGHRSNVTTLHYHPHGDFIASGGVDMHVKIWDVRKKSCVQTYKGHGAEVTCVRFSPDGRWLTTAAKDGLLSLWDLKVGKMLHSLPVGRGAAPSADAPPPTGPSSVHVTSFEFNPCELLLAAATTERAVRVYDLETYQPLARTPPEPSQVRALSFSADGEALVAATESSLRAWTWEPKVKCARHVEVGWDKVSSIVPTAGNAVLGAAFQSNYVTLWSVDLADLAGKPPATAPAARHAVSPAKAPAAAPPARRSSPITHDGGAKADLPPRQSPARRPSASSAAAVPQQQQQQQQQQRAAVAEEKLSGSSRHRSVGTEMSDSFAAKAAAAEAERARGPDTSPLRSLLPASQFKGTPTTPDGWFTEPYGNDFSPAPRRPGAAAGAAADAAAGKDDDDAILAQFEQHLSMRTSPAKATAATAAAAAASSARRHSDETPAAEAKPGGRAVPAPAAAPAPPPPAAAAGMGGGAVLSAVLSSRLTHLRLLAGRWQAGDVGGTVTHLASLFPGGKGAKLDAAAAAVAADFLDAVDVRSEGLTLDIATRLLPVLRCLLAARAAAREVAVAARAAGAVAAMYSGYVRETILAVEGGRRGEVNLSAEERYERCRRCDRELRHTFDDVKALRGCFADGSTADLELRALGEALCVHGGGGR